MTENFIDAITYYGWRRFKTGRGVSQPSQQRYIQYFEMALKKQVQSPSMKKLTKIVIKTLPESTGNSIVPVIEIMDGIDFHIIWTNNPDVKTKLNNSKVQLTKYQVGKDNYMTIESTDTTTGEGIALSGDISFRLVNQKNKKPLCRFAMNTAFVDNKTGIYRFDKKGVDPDSIMKNKKFHNNF